jgi:hypothetical protein
MLQLAKHGPMGVGAAVLHADWLGDGLPESLQCKNALWEVPTLSSI